MSLKPITCHLLICDEQGCEAHYDNGEYTPHFGSAESQNASDLIPEMLEGSDWQELYLDGQTLHRCGRHRVPADWCGYCGDEILKYGFVEDEVWRHEATGDAPCPRGETEACPEGEMPEVLEPGVPL